MHTEPNRIEEKILTTKMVYGIEDMLSASTNTPLHSTNTKEIEDFGELCDSDCVDCD